MRQEGRSLLTEARRLEAQAVELELDTATVLCATLTGLDSEVLGQRQFELARLSMTRLRRAQEPGIAGLPYRHAHEVVLAGGDHSQLPPTVLSRDAIAEGFPKSACWKGWSISMASK